MREYLAILRGINVSGKNKILMKDLKMHFEKNGFENVITYIQSGNILFNLPDAKEINQIEDLISQIILDEYYFNIPVIVLELKFLKRIIENNPFKLNANFDSTKLYITFLKDSPLRENLKKIEEYDYPPDEFIIKNNLAYIYCPEKYGKTKLSNKFFENKLKVSATTRNWKTINKVIDLAKE